MKEADSKVWISKVNGDNRMTLSRAVCREVGIAPGSRLRQWVENGRVHIEKWEGSTTAPGENDE